MSTILGKIMYFLRRGERRRQSIVDMLARNPDRGFTLREICIWAQSWAGPIYADMQTLEKRDLVTCRQVRKRIGGRDQTAPTMYYSLTPKARAMRESR